MKKLLKKIIFFLMFSTLTFAGWKVGNVVDDFKEDTGITRLINYPTNTIPPELAGIAVQKMGVDGAENKYMVALLTNQPVKYKKNKDSKTTIIKIKTEKSKIYETIALVYFTENFTEIAFMLDDELVEFMKKSNILKIVYNETAETTKYLEFDIKDTEKYLKNLKN